MRYAKKKKLCAIPYVSPPHLIHAALPLGGSSHLVNKALGLKKGERRRWAANLRRIYNNGQRLMNNIGYYLIHSIAAPRTSQGPREATTVQRQPQRPQLLSAPSPAAARTWHARHVRGPGGRSICLWYQCNTSLPYLFVTSIKQRVIAGRTGVVAVTA